MTSETAFRSDEQFDQKGFRRWLDRQPGSDRNHYELLNGRIVMIPPAGWPHSRIATTIVTRLSLHVEQSKLGIVLESSAGYDLPSGDTLEPDASFITTQRLKAGPKPETGKFLRIVPNLVVEILSPSTAQRDRTEKKEVYARNGVDEYWIVDAARKEVTVFSRTGRRFGPAKNCSKGRIASKLLSTLDLPVTDLFDF
jgi:Uma2 family endonuclease